MVLVALLVYAAASAVALKRPVSDFYAAWHADPAAYKGMAIAACFVSALAYPAHAGALGPGWRGALIILAGGAGGLIVIALLLAPYLRRFGGYTVSDFLGERFEVAGLRPLAVAAVFICSFPALAAALVALAVIVARLFAAGVFAQGIAFPTVARDKARVRTIVSAAHSRDELQFALDVFAKVGREMGIV